MSRTLPALEDAICPQTGDYLDKTFYLLGYWIPKKRVEAFLQSRTLTTSGCHISSLSPSKTYAQMSIRQDGQTFNVSLHRLAYELWEGPLGTLNACHTCDVKRCVNPSHLFKGTTLDNVRDYLAKGGTLGGGEPWFPELLGEMVRLRSEGWSHQRIGNKLGVTQELVSMYLRKYTQ